MRLLTWLLLVLAVAAPPDPILQLASTYCLSYRLGQIDSAGATAGLRPRLVGREGVSFTLRLQQLAGLQRAVEAVGAVNGARTAVARAAAADEGKRVMQGVPAGLPTGDLTVIPHLPLTTYMEFTSALYREVAPDPAGVDPIFLAYAGYRRSGLGIVPSLEKVRGQLEPYRSQVARSLKLPANSPSLKDSETRLWGSYFELRWQHEAYLVRWEAHARSLYLLLLTHLAAMDPVAGATTAGPGGEAARRAGDEAGREVVRAGADLRTGTELVERRWKAAGGRHYADFRLGYLAGLRSAPGPLFRGADYQLQAPFGWLLQATPADLHLIHPEGELQLSVWSYDTEPGLGPDAVFGLVDARLREDANLTEVSSPAAYGLTGARWNARQPALGAQWQVICLPAGPPPARSYVVLIGVAPPARQEELLAVLRRMAGSLTPLGRSVAEGP